MDEESIGRHVLQRQSPIHSRITSTHQKYPLPSVRFRIGDGEIDSPAEKLLVSGTLQPKGLESPLPSCQEEGSGSVLARLPVKNPKVSFPSQPQDLLIQNYLGIELKGLGDEVPTQFPGKNFREASHIVDVLLWVEGHELAAQFRQRVDEPNRQLSHPGKKGGIKPGWAATYDGNIRYVPLHVFLYPRQGRKPSLILRGLFTPEKY